jgi:hypothetical protein
MEQFEPAIAIDMPARWLTRTAAFARWFAASSVVDAAGLPLVVYHGTRVRVDFDRFEVPAHFGSTVPANEMATNGGLWGPGRVIPVYLSIQNPKRVVDQAGSGWGLWDDVVELAIAEGHDGLFYENSAEGSGTTSWVAFSAKQIKSVFNSGRFDPESSSLLDLDGGGDEAMSGA